METRWKGSLSLIVLTYPNLEKTDWDWIQEIRALHDQRLFQIVDPHFTLVFPLSGLQPEALIKHVRQQTLQRRPMQFVLRSALVVKDPLSEAFHTFLVPDEGFSQIVRLHDSLYRGVLRDQLRLDIPYIPHIAVGRSTDPKISRQLADEINLVEPEIVGSIDALDVVQIENQSLRTIMHLNFPGIPLPSA